MLRLMLVIMIAATVAIIVAAVFFMNDGPVAGIDREAMGLYNQGQYDAAISVWRQGLEKYPDSAQLNGGLGTMLAVRKDFAASAKYLEKAVALAPEEPKFRKELALLYFQQKRLDDAERELKAVIAEADWYPEAHFYLGHLYEQRGMRDQALQEYVKELNVNPCSTFAWARVQMWQEKSDPGK
jgi:tetratricopeptide (TPR) repeat protein